jgi:hypothetical protein
LRRYIPAVIGLAGLICLNLAAFLLSPILGLGAVGVSLLVVAITLNGAST